MQRIFETFDMFTNHNIVSFSSVFFDSFAEKFSQAITTKLRGFVRTEADRWWIQTIIRRRLTKDGIIAKTAYDGTFGG